MSNAQEKRVARIAELKGFRLEKAGHGKWHGRFYITNVAKGGRVRSDVLDHEYSFSLEEAEARLSARPASRAHGLSAAVRRRDYS
jgi:hypothetical protein